MTLLLVSLKPRLDIQMEDNAYSDYISESTSWLHKGRMELIKQIMQRHVSGKTVDILEIGAGIGQNIPVLSQWGNVDALEINEKGIESLKGIDSIRNLITVPIPEKLDRKYDVIGAFDVIEHIENDKEAVDWLFEHLNDDGIVIATAPAYQWLFGDHDRVLMHYRRYSLSRFTFLFKDDFTVVKKSYFNMFLFPLAVTARSLLFVKSLFKKKKVIEKQKVPKSSLLSFVFYRILKIESKLIKYGVKLPFGLTVVICAKKKSV